MLLLLVALRPLLPCAPLPPPPPLFLLGILSLEEQKVTDVHSTCRAPL